MRRLRITAKMTKDAVFRFVCACTRTKRRLRINREDYVFNRTSNISLRSLKKVMVNILFGLRRAAAYCLGDIFIAASSALMDLFWKEIILFKKSIKVYRLGGGGLYCLRKLKYLQNTLYVHTKEVATPPPKVHVSVVIWHILQGCQKRPNGTVSPVICHLKRYQLFFLELITSREEDKNKKIKGRKDHFCCLNLFGILFD